MVALYEWLPALLSVVVVVVVFSSCGWLPALVSVLSLLKYDRGVVNYLVGVDVCWGCPLHAVVNQINNWLVIIVCFVVGGSCFVLLVV